MSLICLYQLALYYHQAATEGLLYELAQYGTLVWELNNFIDIVVSGAQYWGPHKSSESAEVETTQGRDKPSTAEDDRNRATNTSDNTDTMTSPPFKACQTYQAFAASLSHHLQTFKKELLLLEKTAVKQGQFFNNTVEHCQALPSKHIHLYDIYTTFTRQAPKLFIILILESS